MSRVSQGWEISGWIVIGFNCLSFPIIIYYTIQFWRLKNDPYIAPRLPQNGVWLMVFNGIAVTHSMFDALIAMEIVSCSKTCLGADLAKSIFKYPGIAFFSFKLCLYLLTTTVNS